MGYETGASLVAMGMLPGIPSASFQLPSHADLEALGWPSGRSLPDMARLLRMVSVSRRTAGVPQPQRQGFHLNLGF